MASDPLLSTAQHNVVACLINCAYAHLSRHGRPRELAQLAVRIVDGDLVIVCLRAEGLDLQVCDAVASVTCNSLYQQVCNVVASVTCHSFDLQVSNAVASVIWYSLELA